MNAIALDEETGEDIDPHDGQEDIRRGVIRCVGNPMDRFFEDALRMLRAIRFAVTKGFVIHPDVEASLFNEVLGNRLVLQRER